MFRQKIKKLKKPLAGMTAVLAVGSVAFALLQSQATLTGNSISTGTANLLISQNDTNYGQTTSGYAFTGIIPGSQPSQTEHFMLKNVGDASLSLKLSLASPPSNPDDADLDKVHVILTPYSTTTFMPGTPQTFSLQSLLTAGAPGVAVDYPDPLSAGSKEEFNVQMDMDGDAVNGHSASLSGIDLALTGVAVSNTN